MDIIEKRGFGSFWRKWIEMILHGGSVGVIVNNKDSEFFLTDKGLRQGDSLSPILFNLMVDAFTKMLQKGAECNLIKGFSL